MELEVREFKKEIERKFQQSSHNINYRFPFERRSEQSDDNDEELSHLKDTLSYDVHDINKEPPKQESKSHNIKNLNFAN